MAFFSNVAKFLNQATGSQGPRWFINQRFGRFGEMTQLKIDHEAKTMEMEIMLKGEKEPITVSVGGYELQTGADGAASMMLRDVHVSREWMQVAADEFLKKPVPVPPEMMKWLKLVL